MTPPDTPEAPSQAEMQKLLEEIKQLQSCLYDAARAVGVPGVLSGDIGSDGIELSHADFEERGEYIRTLEKEHREMRNEIEEYRFIAERMGLEAWEGRMNSFLNRLTLHP